MTFEGTFQHAIDAKGRTSLPARFRELLAGAGADKLYVTTDLYEKFLLAFAPAQWEAFKAKVSALPSFDATTRQLVRTVISPAQPCTFDKLGRILVPPPLREFAGLSNEVIWAGANDRIELWSPQGWAKYHETARAPDVQADIASRLGRLL